MVKTDILPDTAFGFLEEVETFVRDSYSDSEINRAFAYAFQDNVSKFLQNKMVSLLFLKYF